MSENTIRGVEFKPLKTHADDRGFFREIIRVSDSVFQLKSAEDNQGFAPDNQGFAQYDQGFAQWSHSLMAKNTVKAWHFHHLQIDWWYLALGVIETVLFDNRKESPTYQKKLVFKLGDPGLDPEAQCSVVRIPQGVLHGCKVLSQTAHLFYITSKIYDPEDEGRLPYNSPIVNHPWGKEEELTVAANDRIEKLPRYPLTPSW
jgi:dTDP-4-dehydrorhamnose 3,5-epimerase